MPWNSNNGGGWKGGAGGPWGQSPGGGSPPPDLEEFLKRSQDKLRQAMPGGIGFAGSFLFSWSWRPPSAILASPSASTRTSAAIVQRFGKFDRELSNGINFRWPYPVEEVTVIPYTRQNRIEIGFSTGASGPFGRSARRTAPRKA